jgi:lysophospholipid acyltransferase (LPLAT)-like uncharacterized protein
MRRPRWRRRDDADAVGLLKRIVRSPPGRRLIGALGATYVRLVHGTTRWTTVRGDTPEPYWTEGRAMIGCFWHNRMLLMRFIWPAGRPVAMLISRHGDGLLISEIIRHFDVRTIAGSSSRGGTDALREMLAALKSGITVAVTPDGPRGPRMHATAGVVRAARLAGAPLVPVSVAMRRRKMLGSWDRFLLAWPFNDGVFVWGRPFEVAADADDTAIEAARAALETELNRISAEADRLVGQTPIEPA